jgi:hypothetical protein
MTLINGARLCSGTFADGFGPHDDDKKKARWLSGLQTIFLEENSGDRCNYAALRYVRPMMNSDTGYYLA